MYLDHCYQIQRAFESDPEEILINSVTLALASIQQQFHTVPAILDSWREVGVSAPTMWGMKRDGYQYIRDHSTRLAALILFELREKRAAEAIDTMLEVPGLNTVKAAFVCQLLGFPTVCIDTQNAKLYGIDPFSFKVERSTSTRTRAAKIAAYVELGSKLGGAQRLWDTWCELIALEYPRHFADADEVSALHPKQIIGPF